MAIQAKLPRSAPAGASARQFAEVRSGTRSPEGVPRPSHRAWRFGLQTLGRGSRLIKFYSSLSSSSRYRYPSKIAFAPSRSSPFSQVPLTRPLA